MTILQDARIIDAIKTSLEVDFEDVKIIEVRVFEENDFEDDDVLRIEVVFDGERKHVKAGAVSGAVRHVRPKLRDLGKNGFPVFSFISKSDEGLRLGPA